MAFAVQATPAAAAAIEALRGRARKRYETLERELRTGGCKAAGYRLLAGEQGSYSEYCCKALAENWRVITTFEPGVAVIIALGRHDTRDFYAGLATILEIGAVGQGRKAKPDCCGASGWPSVGETRKGPRKRTGR